MLILKNCYKRHVFHFKNIGRKKPWRIKTNGIYYKLKFNFWRRKTITIRVPVEKNELLRERTPKKNKNSGIWAKTKLKNYSWRNRLKTKRKKLRKKRRGGSFKKILHGNLKTVIKEGLQVKHKKSNSIIQWKIVIYKLEFNRRRCLKKKII